MSLLPFCEWLASTEGSIALKESLYMWAIVESVHVWTLPLFLGLIVMLDFRLLGATMRRIPVSEISGQLVPWAVAGFVVMVTTGSLLFYATPVKTYQNVFFRAKVIMLVLTGVNVWMFQTGVYRSVAEWDLASVLPRRARMAAIISLVLWIAIVFAGRMTAYYWFDCDRQPQPAIVNVLQGCNAGTP